MNIYLVMEDTLDGDQPYRWYQDEETASLFVKDQQKYKDNGEPYANRYWVFHKSIPEGV